MFQKVNNNIPNRISKGILENINSNFNQTEKVF